MDVAGISGRKGIRATAAAFLAVLFLLSISSCGKKEGVSSNRPEGMPGTVLPASGGTQGAPGLPGDEDIVIVDPMAPCRSVPPGVSVRSAAGRVAEIRGVQWFVNGAEQDTGPRLAPSRFRRGDRIHAVVNLRVGDTEKPFTTREAVAGNSPPAVSDVRIEPRSPVSGSTVRAVVQAVDPDEDPLKIKFQWYVDDVPVPGDADRLTLNGVKRGAWIHVTATPNDGFGDGAWGESPRHQVVNALPVVKSELPKELPPGRRFLYLLEAADPDGDTLTYTLTKGPPGMVLNGATLDWEVPERYLGQPIDIVVEISDGQGGRTEQNISMTVQPPGGGR